jgi:hypothetical protein
MVTLCVSCEHTACTGRSPTCAKQQQVRACSCRSAQQPLLVPCTTHTQGAVHQALRLPQVWHPIQARQQVNDVGCAKRVCVCARHRCARLLPVWQVPPTTHQHPAPRAATTATSQTQRRYYSYQNTGLQQQFVLFGQDSLTSEPVVLLDPNSLSDDGTVALKDAAFSDDVSQLAYSLSSGGSDWATIKVRACWGWRGVALRVTRLCGGGGGRGEGCVRLQQGPVSGGRAACMCMCVRVRVSAVELWWRRPHITAGGAASLGVRAEQRAVAARACTPAARFAPGAARRR